MPIKKTIQKKLLEAAAKRLLEEIKPAQTKPGTREIINVFNIGVYMDKKQFDRLKYRISRDLLKKLISHLS